MVKKIGMVGVLLLVAACIAVPFSDAAELSKERAVEAAKEALKEKGVVLEDVEIVYDEKNKTWEEWGMYVEETPADPNHGILPHGVLRNKQYQAVFFDFKEGAPEQDTWVFVDTDTGEVLTVYELR